MQYMDEELLDALREQAFAHDELCKCRHMDLERAKERLAAAVRVVSNWYWIRQHDSYTE
jgi:hypothetical protein